jgi:hypothetical protein
MCVSSSFAPAESGDAAHFDALLTSLHSRRATAASATTALAAALATPHSAFTADRQRKEISHLLSSPSLLSSPLSFSSSEHMTPASSHAVTATANTTLDARYALPPSLRGTWLDAPSSSPSMSTSAFPFSSSLSAAARWVQSRSLVSIITLFFIALYSFVSHQVISITLVFCQSHYLPLPPNPHALRIAFLTSPVWR